MTYDQAVQYLLSLGRELASPRQARTAKFDLVNISALAARLAHPERAYRSVHIAGTNGKGSTAAMLASILRAARLKTGLYTSPHLLRINERIRMDGEDISDADFAAAFSRVHAAIEELLADGVLTAHPTYFECVTAMAFDYFALRQADIVVFEVGLGGRLDSTNVISPDVAVITQIDFDHENFLGTSIEEIAGEKAGIIKPGAVVISAAGHPSAAAVIRDRAVEQQARIVEVGSAWRVSNLRAENGCYSFQASLADQPDAGGNIPIQVSLPLPGRFQVRNALTAMTAARELCKRGLAIDDTAMIRGLAAVRWPGRLERLQDRPAIYVDGTHNPAGARELVAFWTEHFSGRRIHLVYGAMRDKAVDEIAGLLFPCATSVTLTQSPQPRSISADVLASLTRHLAPSVAVVSDPAQALEYALAQAAADDAVFCTGSLYLVGDIRRAWNARSSDNEPQPATLRPARSA